MIDEISTTLINETLSFIISAEFGDGTINNDAIIYITYIAKQYKQKNDEKTVKLTGNMTVETKKIVSNADQILPIPSVK